MGRLSGTGKQFVSASLYEVGSTVPLVAVGEPMLITTAGPARVQAMIDQALAAPQLSVSDLLDLPGRRLGYTFKSVETPVRYVVYAETALPERTTRSRTTGPFEDLDYATYLGDSASTGTLLYASVEDVPIHGRSSETVVPFGDRHLVLVTATTATLAGELSRLLPFLIAVPRRHARRGRCDPCAAAPSPPQRSGSARRRCLPPLRGRAAPRRDAAAQPAPASFRHRPVCWWRPATGPLTLSSEIGGDFYDLFQVGPGRWGITIGDVCGKGIEAAGLTGVTRHTIRVAARHLDSPADVLGWTYEAISAYDAETYATVCFAFLILDDDRAELDIALGGHPGPLLSRADGSVDVLGIGGTVIGLVEPHVTRTRHALEPGDTVVFYTDGVTDAAGDAAVSVDEVQATIRASAELSPAETADAIRASIERRRPGGSKDDTAILVLRFAGTPEPSGADRPMGRGTRRPLIRTRDQRCLNPPQASTRTPSRRTGRRPFEAVEHHAGPSRGRPRPGPSSALGQLG